MKLLLHFARLDQETWHQSSLWPGSVRTQIFRTRLMRQCLESCREIQAHHAHRPFTKRFSTRTYTPNLCQGGYVIIRVSLLYR